MQRRTYLTGSGLVVVAALAGCTAGTDIAGDEEPQPEDDPDDESGAESGEPSDEDAGTERIDRGELETMTRRAVDEELENAEESVETDQGNEGQSDEGEDGQAGDEADREGEGEQADPGPDLDDTVYAQVDYEGEWVFAYSTRDRTGSFEGADFRTLEIDDEVEAVSIAVQKADDSDGELTALVLLDGRIMAEGSTSESFGIAEATHSIY